MDELRDEKYIVFKREDWQEWWGQWQGEMSKAPASMVTNSLDDLEELSLDDGVVIRTQDVFSGPALATYANSIQVAIDILRMSDPVDEYYLQRLRDTADYCHQQSEIAFHRPDQKIPD
ncbi:MAG: hypothetical protein ACRD8U_15995 [Pyrinomonadaceae bacterium]